MHQNSVILILLVVLLLGFLLSTLLPKKQEKWIAFVAIITSALSAVLYGISTIFWIKNDFKSFDFDMITLYHSSSYQFILNIFFDKSSVVFGLVGSILTFCIAYFCRIYMHKENGYKRFFVSVLFFFLGYNFILLAGNFETLFIGWEIIGLSSFLLIAFYRERYLPVKNAIKVFSIYRIGDVGLLLAIWLSHDLWHENISFAKLQNYELVHEVLSMHNVVGIFISLFILLAAMAKSAQFPFSSWLPRAMEGPTPSSAIFYGSLSVHFGVFLLIRTFPFWEHQISIRIGIALIGLVTIFSATAIGKVQSNIKAQIAYASIAQIGIMFVEVALGATSLALVHFAGNAFLRSYQLLISPSSVTYLVKEQLYHFNEEYKGFENKLTRKIRYKWFIWNLKEWELDNFFALYIFSPLKRIGRNLDFLHMKNLAFLVFPIYAFGWFMALYGSKNGVIQISGLPYLYSLIGLIMVLKSFSERRDPLLAWTLLFINNLFVSLALTLNDNFLLTETVIYLSGVTLSFFVGTLALYLLRKKEKTYFTLNKFYGHIEEHKWLHILFLFSCLGLICFPISPSFLGVDLVFSHIHNNQFFLALFNALGFVLSGISVMRIYARLYLGPHIKTYHSTTIKTA